MSSCLFLLIALLAVWPYFADCLFPYFAQVPYGSQLLAWRAVSRSRCASRRGAASAGVGGALALAEQGACDGCVGRVREAVGAVDEPKGQSVRGIHISVNKQPHATPHRHAPGGRRVVRQRRSVVVVGQRQMRQHARVGCGACVLVWYTTIRSDNTIQNRKNDKMR